MYTRAGERQDMPDKAPISPKIAGDHHFELPRFGPCSDGRFRRSQRLSSSPWPVYAALLVLGPKGAICTALAWNFMALHAGLWDERLPGCSCSARWA